MQSTSDSGFRFTGWHMLGVVCLFFATIISVNFYMAYSATRTWTGLVVQNSYVASQQFNEKLATAREQIARGWQGGLEYAGGELVFTLVDGNDTPLPATSVTIAVSRPIGTEGDRTVELTRQQDGRFTASVDLTPGVWNAAIVATFEDGPDYEHHARLIVGGNR